MSAFQSIRCSIPSALEEELPTLLFGVPVLGTEINNRRGDRAEVTVYLSGSDVEWVAEVNRAIAEAGGLDFEVAIVEEEDWMANYRRAVQPFEVGATWWIDPHPDTPTAAPPERRRLVIPPRMAFGSGSHESTRLILEALESADIVGRNVLDAGTGSGILALACDVLGARRVLGVDIDPFAVHTARQIRDLQAWKPRAHYAIGSIECAVPGFFDFVLCNMITAHFLPLLDRMSAALAPGGTLVLAGLLVEEVDSISGEIERCGMLASSTAALGEWASLSARLPR